MSESGDVWTIRRLLEWTTGFFTRKKVDSARLSAELLLSHVLNIPRIKLYTDYEKAVGAQELSAYRGLVQRAVEEEPIAYLTGRAHFFALEFEVNRDVLIPRPDTETLVENVLQTVRYQPELESPRVLDLCTGSGCVAAAIATNLKTAVVTAVEISPAAAAVALKNFQRLKLAERITLLTGDLYEPLKTQVDVQPFHLIVSNPPYIASDKVGALPRSVKDYEPMLALDGGPDGLSFHRRILSGASDRLLPGGRVFIEIAFDEGPAAIELAAEYPAFEEPRILKDYGGNDRVLTAKKK